MRRSFAKKCSIIISCPKTTHKKNIFCSNRTIFDDMTMTK
ncbi:hypothetical protein CLOSTASPAR_04330 [[Clostridium] asparagiforme DSM 15981]|uniref:Uncharacterized protein n=1 Tax=[Clostridium] asparagiforme DSM 15981 TaxID=518636 RepID=C0D4Y2_9FIRM|nr:hypothetical protein CLOSTASPAR_04330 [[Clostridium] asparagiforme DSM 15981]